eukprot:3430555-Amphidinium_carterae.1
MHPPVLSHRIVFALLASTLVEHEGLQEVSSCASLLNLGGAAACPPRSAMLPARDWAVLEYPR